MLEGDVDVDHVIPRQFIYHDEPWNLVLAHTHCNLQKSDALPGLGYLEKLIERNEHFIASNHPLKKKFIGQLGKTPEQRNSRINQVYRDAESAIPYTWEGIRGYDPQW
jgi:CRISPR/Cas system Type II protein with McrA/HNH and RuvC-like nuclease domain